MFLENTESTIMSILHGVARGDDPGRSLYLERFCETYSEPLVEFLATTKKLPNDEARDLVHDFWMKKLLDVPAYENLISKYLKSMQSGESNSFRRYLARSLTLHFISQWRSATARKDRKALSLDHAFDAEPANEPDLAAFDNIWASHLFQKVIDGVRQECLRDGDATDRWKVFVELKLKPCLLGTEAMSYSELAEHLELPDPKSVGNSWITVKRMFERHLHRAVEDYIPAASIAESSQATAAEVKELLRQLAGMRALQVSVPELVNASSNATDISAFELSDPTSDTVYQTNKDLQMAWSNLLHAPLNNWLLDGDAPETATLSSVLEDPKPSRDLLDTIRSQAKRQGRSTANRLQPCTLVPTEFYAVTYLLAVVLSSVRLKENISTSKPSEIRSKMEAVRLVPWLDKKSKSTLE